MILRTLLLVIALGACAKQSQPESPQGSVLTVTKDESSALSICGLLSDIAETVARQYLDGVSEEAVRAQLSRSSDEKLGKALYGMADKIVIPEVYHRNNPTNSGLAYSAAFYQKCTAQELRPKLVDIGTQCYQLGQFFKVAAAFKAAGQPVETVYEKIPAGDDYSKRRMDAVLERVRSTSSDPSSVASAKLDVATDCMAEHGVVLHP
jgi:hypothetical protein